MLIKKNISIVTSKIRIKAKKVPDPAGQKSLDTDPDPEPHHYFQVLYVQEVVTHFI